MKTLFMTGVLVLTLSMDVEANLLSRWSQVQHDAPGTSEIVGVTNQFSRTDSYQQRLQLSRVYIDLGIHGLIGRHGQFDLYFGGPSRHYYRPYYSPHRYRHYRHYRQYYPPFPRHRYEPRWQPHRGKHFQRDNSRHHRDLKRGPGHSRERWFRDR